MNEASSLAEPCFPLPRRAVVTGAAGFIGSHLAQALLGHGVTVIGVDRRSAETDPSAAANLAALHQHPGFIPITADLSTCAIEPLLLDADVVFHLAGIPGVRPSWGPRFHDYVACNILAAQRIMDAATLLRVPRLVVASSSSVYGHTDGRPSTESDPVRPASPYAVTKLAEEQLCLAHATRPDCATTVVALRYFTVFGPRQREDMVVHRILAAAVEGRPFPIYGDGSQRRDFTYVQDAVAATISAATAPIGSAVINVGAGTTFSLLDVIKHARYLTGRPVVTEHSPRRHGDVPATCADSAAARRLLGWVPSVDLVTGMAAQLATLTAAHHNATL
ncbi:NAD-dependent epimerase/dehydratase family protein [Planotetraspora mira]|uniref:Putative UDP-glucose epimerase YtcB n=1 Tax=Planotetraspora mira TaxID=58121 RepID=A0A8J3TXP0_9ACTN|nr:NAD-dependent epimerase/dehydratase family protein [Planotetraspora mira]GII34630.1 putative UDP-glucose epimerase YtcB [Planotetraspora mira]